MALVAHQRALNTAGSEERVADPQRSVDGRAELGEFALGVDVEPPADPDEDDVVPVGVHPAEAGRTLERVKHFLWHSNTFRALDLLGNLVEDFECIEEPDPRQQAFLSRLTEFQGYVESNAATIPNYGERRRCGEPVSSAVTESTVNQVVSRRMVKKQQMRWSPRGAHLLLQLRTRVLNGDLDADFARWYPGFTTPDPPATVAA